MSKWPRSFVRSALFLCAGLAACEDPERKPLPDWRLGYADAGVVDAQAEPQNAFALVSPDSVDWPVRLGKRDAPEEPCAVKRNDSTREIECMLDVNELDLWVLGLRYDIIVPPSMCDMLSHSPYIFANFEVGKGPDRVAYTVNMDGTFSDQLNAMNGEPFCPFDHTREDPKGPNCCTGNYQLEIKSALTGKVARSTQSWGGKIGDCYFGAGFVQKDAPVDVDGMPMPQYEYTHGDAHRERIVYPGVSAIYPANTALANYFNPDDHDGKAPAGLSAPRARPYYDAFCLDDAEEIVAHIRLSVREWNEEAEYHALGNPDTTGTESLWNAGPTDIDDLFDWGALTPGSKSYPRLRIAR